MEVFFTLFSTFIAFLNCYYKGLLLIQEALINRQDLESTMGLFFCRSHITESPQTAHFIIEDVDKRYPIGLKIISIKCPCDKSRGKFFVLSDLRCRKEHSDQPADGIYPLG